MSMERSWHGLELEERVQHATGRAIIGIGMAVVVNTKEITHVITGTLRRSTHMAPVDYDGSGDESAAQTQDMSMLMSSPEVHHDALGASIEVGSWLPYACAEWIGRGHPGITQGVESVRGVRTQRIVAQSFAEEGL